MGPIDPDSAAPAPRKHAPDSATYAFRKHRWTATVSTDSEATRVFLGCENNPYSGNFPLDATQLQEIGDMLYDVADFVRSLPGAGQ